MDFFQRQDTARRKTSLLVLLFIAAVTLVIFAVNAAIFLIFKLSNPYQIDIYQWWLGEPAIYTALATLLVITGGSISQYLKLRSGGGAAVAKMAGAEKVTMTSQDSSIRIYINIVEEMAIASGLPVPEIFLMAKESSINAFVAGYTPADTVIVVTEGALRNLTRDELQGVIGHEFSHILHADTAINLRLMALLAGILFIGHIGQYLMRSSGSRRHSRRTKEDGGLFIAGLALAAIGYIGVLMGRLIKAAVSRQREFLADASSVQFTRNPEGIAGALFAIDQHAQSSYLEHTVQAESMNHMCFGETIKMGFSQALASHPPTRERIDAIGNTLFAILRSKKRKIYPENTKKQSPQEQPSNLTNRSSFANNLNPSNSAPTVDAINPGSPTPAMTHAQSRTQKHLHLQSASIVSTAGEVTADDVDHAREMLKRMPLELHELSHSLSGAAALVIGLLANENRFHPNKARIIYSDQQFNFDQHIDIKNVITKTRDLSEQLRMPLLELCAPNLKAFKPNLRAAFLSSLYLVAKSDGKISIFEFLCLSFLEQQLPEKVRRPKFSRTYKLSDLSKEISIVLTLLHRAGTVSNSAPDKALLNEVLQRLCGSATNIYTETLNTRIVSAALLQLQQLSPLLKKPLLEAATDLILADSMITTREYEILRVLASCMDCPMPVLMTRPTNC